MEGEDVGGTPVTADTLLKTNEVSQLAQQLATQQTGLVSAEGALSTERDEVLRVEKEAASAEVSSLREELRQD